MDCDHAHRDRLLLQVTIALAIATRLWLMATQPLTDLTEARYGELARVTAEGGYWLMPHLAPTTPFLAKPPLSTWLSALSWKFLGHNEFFLRLPSLLVSLFSGALLFAAAPEFGIGRSGRWMAAAALVTSPIWIVCAGSVMTDATQMAVVIAAMTSSWLALRHPETVRWRRIFWGTLGVATLSKGIATLALIGLPLIAYVVFGEGLKRVWSALWDWTGVLLAAAIALGWYVPAEISYPGFLNYFLVGEHFRRFLEPNWNGDRFGHPHSVTLGTIWLYWVAATAFWFPVMLQQVGQKLARRDVPAATPADRWLWCWVLAPLVFFTFSRNILWTYTLTAIPPFALLIGRWAEANTHWGRRATPALLAVASSVVFGFAVFWAPSRFESRSARELVQAATARGPERPLYFSGCFQFSSRFYTGGAAERADGPEALEKVMQHPGTLVIATPESARHEIGLGRARLISERPNAFLIEVVEPRYASR